MVGGIGQFVEDRRAPHRDLDALRFGGFDAQLPALWQGFSSWNLPPRLNELVHLNRNAGWVNPKAPVSGPKRRPSNLADEGRLVSHRRNCVFQKLIGGQG